MILVKTNIRKQFDIVEHKEELVSTVEAVLSKKLLNDYNNLINDLISQGKIKKRSRKFKRDEVDNWSYESIILYDDIETHKMVFDSSIFQEILENLNSAGFKIKIDVKNIRKLLTNAI